METGNDNLDERVGGIPVRSEQIGFSGGEMIECGSCRRANPPNRLQCMYCSAALDLPEAAANSIHLKLREVESWEKGFNVVIVPSQISAVTDAAIRAAESASIDQELFKLSLEAGHPMPLIRVGSEEEAKTVVMRLETAGLRIVVVPDEDLKPGVPPVRIRSIDLADGKFSPVTFNSNEVFEHNCSDIVAIVTGSLIESKTESTFKKNGKETKTLDETNFGSDFGVIDVYVGGNTTGYRITAHGFDFSCLGAEKSVLAVENLLRLVDRLRIIAPQARFVSDYVDNRKDLDSVWQPTRHSESNGLKRSGLGFSLSKGEVTSNAEQFTKYSRLQRILI
ncbi:MAG TPA: hypothetical protein VK612_09980 [Pyrinomonadaceae bacterium]|nr:hypothetical protein [Pyrinomonadaceae bacterium]